MLYLHAMVVNTELLLLLVQVNISGLSKKTVSFMLQTAVLFAGCTCTYAKYSRVLKYGLGLCCVSKNTYYKTIQKLVPIVTFVYLIHNAPWQSKT